MRSKTYSSEAIILARKKYSEADRIVTAYTKNYGKMTFVAKGIRKPKSKKRGSLEVFSRIKYAAARTKGFDILTEVEIIDNFEELRKDLKKVSVAYYFVETVSRLTQEENKNIEVYSLLNNYLVKLTNSQNLKELRKDFTYQILVLLGFWPEGKEMENGDTEMEKITERQLNSVRVGKKLVV